MRSMPSSILRHAVVLGAIILALCGSPSQAVSNREALRYDGKNFEQWRQQLRTELKSEVRVEGLKALSAFGVNGYANEATAAICELMRGYDVRTAHKDDALVVAAGLEAIKKIGEESLPELKTALKNDKRNIRRFAVKSLLDLEIETQTAAVLDVIAALGDTDWYINYRCLDILQGIEMTSKTRKAIKARARQIIPALVNVLKTSDHRNEDCRFQATALIGLCGPEGKSAVPALIEELNKEARLRQLAEVIYTLGEMGPEAKDALPILKSRFSAYLDNPKNTEKKSKPGWFARPDLATGTSASLTLATYTYTSSVSEGRPLPQTVRETVKKIEGR